MTKKNENQREEGKVSWEFENENGYISGVHIVTKDKEIEIWVDDGYYNFQIPFDKFLEIAEKVRSRMNDKEE